MIRVITREWRLERCPRLEVPIDRGALNDKAEFSGFRSRGLSVSHRLLLLYSCMRDQGDHPCCALWLPICFCLEYLGLLLHWWTELKKLVGACQLPTGSPITANALLDLTWGVKLLLQRLLRALRFARHEDAIGALPLLDSISNVL